MEIVAILCRTVFAQWSYKRNFFYFFLLHSKSLKGQLHFSWGKKIAYKNNNNIAYTITTSNIVIECF